jgi:DNA topoisomerase-1
VRRGRGFSLLDERGNKVSDPEIAARVAELAIPPAWEDVWICPDPFGHLQATGTDAAGRKQYLYHTQWREQRDRRKFREMEDFARALPRLRRRVSSDLDQPELNRPRVLACAVRLLDLGLFRIGSEEYAEQGGGLGLATIRKEHVALGNGTVRFDYPAKSGVRRVHQVSDDASREVVAELRRRRGGPEELLAFKQGGRWLPLRSDDINDYIKERLGDDFSAKDFRTWNATVLAAVNLAAKDAQAPSKTGRKRAINASVRDVAEVLGNTPAVARRSYIDPRVFDRYLSGWTIRVGEVTALDDVGNKRRRRLELAVLDLLDEDAESHAVAVDPPAERRA